MSSKKPPSANDKGGLYEKNQPGNKPRVFDKCDTCGNEIKNIVVDKGKKMLCSDCFVKDRKVPMQDLINMIREKRAKCKHNSEIMIWKPDFLVCQGCGQRI